MTKQQFLDALRQASDYQLSPALYGAAVGCYLDKVRNDAYQQKYGERLPMWDALFFYEITCKDVEHDTPLIRGRWVTRRYITRETYFLGLPVVSQYTSFAADIRSRYTAGDSGVTIESLVTGRSYFFAYADIVEIKACQMQSNQLPSTPPYVGSRCYFGLNHYGFVGATPGVDELAKQAVKFDRWPYADFFR